MFRQALRAGKRVRTETAIAENPASVSSAAAELASRVFGELDGCRILVIGAGKISELAAVNLISRGVATVLVANRTIERAEPLARRFGGRAIAFDAVEDELGRTDIVISSTSAPGFVLTAAQVQRALKARKGRPIFFIDIAVPRDLDPAINQLEGCYLYDIDDLRDIVEESLADRRREAVRIVPPRNAVALIDAEVTTRSGGTVLITRVETIAVLFCSASNSRTCPGPLPESRGDPPSSGYGRPEPLRPELPEYGESA